MTEREKIMHLRRLAGWSQEVMSHNLGLSQRQYGRIESGESKLTLDRFNEICAVWGLTRREFEDLSLEELLIRIGNT